MLSCQEVVGELRSVNDTLEGCVHVTRIPQVGEPNYTRHLIGEKQKVELQRTRIVLFLQNPEAMSM